MTGMDYFERMDVIEDQYIEEAMSEGKGRVSKKKRNWIWIATSIAAAFVLAFVGVVNAFPSVAVAMNDVVGLKELVQLVTVDQGMKACLENEYAQYIGEEQLMDDGHYSKVYYVVADSTHVSIFYKTDVPLDGEEYHHFAYVTQEDGYLIPVFQGIRSYKTDVENMYELRVDFDQELEEGMLPESIKVQLDFGKSYWDGYPSTDGGWIDYPEQTATYEIKLDNIFFVEPIVYDIQEEVEIDGQKLLFEKLEVYPTMTRLFYSEDVNNEYELIDMDVVIVDDKGNEYEQMPEGDFSVEDDTNTIIGQVLGFTSNYFEEDVSLQLEIRGVSWDYGYSEETDVSYEKKSVGDLPEEIELLGMELDEDKTLTIQFKEYSTDLVSYSTHLYDVETGDSCEYDMIEDGDSHWITTFTIPDYREGKCKFTWGKSEDKILEKIIVIEVK